MRVIKTVIWVLLLIALLLFSINNWQSVEIKIWENLILETRLPALVLAAFLLGLLPMWLAAKARKWQMNRRISMLENSVRAASQANPTLVASSSQLEAETTQNQG